MDSDIRRYRFLIGSIVFSWWMHIAAIGGMLLLIGPGLDMDVGPRFRAAFIAEQPWRWRIGWVFWMITAGSDLLISIGLLLFARRFASRAAMTLAGLGVVLVLGAMTADMHGQILMITDQVELAGKAELATPDGLDAFLALESKTLLLTGTCGNALYTLMMLAWVWTLGVMNPSSRFRWALPWVGTMVALAFGASAWVNAAASEDPVRAGFHLNYMISAVAFPLLQLILIWMAGAAGTIQRARFPESDRELHRVRWPDRLRAYRCANLLSAPGIRDFLRQSGPLIPVPEMRSDIRDVVYLNWMVPVERVSHLVPAPLTVDERDGLTAVSVLTYRHGRFGPGFSGPLRSLCPSPCQSNWRLYVNPERDDLQRDAVYFIKTVVDHPLVVAGSRIFTDGLPSHPGRVLHERSDSTIRIEVIPEGGSAPDLESVVEEVDAWTIPDEFTRAFGDHRDEVLRYLIDQNRAVSVHPAHGRILESGIELPIDLADVRPASLREFSSEWLREIVAGCDGFAFIVPEVAFKTTGERWSAQYGV